LNSAFFSGEFIPSIAAGVDDGVVAVEDAVAELVLPQILSDVLDRIEFGRIGRQFEQADIVGHVEFAAGLMPACAVEPDHSMAASRDIAADLGEVQGHCLTVGIGQDKGRAFIACRADRAE
jgi:hypothetical protein